MKDLTRAMSKKSASATAEKAAARPDRPTAAPSQNPGATAFAGHATLRYSTLRLALFVISLLVLWGLAALFRLDLSTDSARLLLLALSLLISSAASLLLLSRQRDAMSAGIVARIQRMSGKFNAEASFEDQDGE